MKRLMLVALAALTLAAPASAQYYGSPYSSPSYEEEWRPSPRYDYDRPRYGYRPRQDYYDQDYGGERRVYRYERPRHEWRRQAQRYGNVCVTSRGSCEHPQSYPLGAKCRCDIPGFGPKRGNIGY